jgi:carboxyl-terminal processing protease
MTRTRAYVALALFAVVMLAGGQLLRASLAGGGVARAALFDQVLTHVEDNYVDSLDPADLYAKAATGMVAELHDPNSSLLDERLFKRLTETTAGQYEGLGVQIDVRDGWLSVIAPLAGSPAEVAGLRAGDRIIEIDGRAVSARTADSARAGLRGAPGSKVTLLVERPGVAARIPIVVTRAEIHVNPVRHAMMLTGDAGYVQLAVFADSSAKELRRAVERLRASGARTILLDLRGDPGGLLAQGVGVSDEFLDEGQAVVSLRGRTPASTVTISDQHAQLWPGLLLIVLVDEGSASASEIVAGALQDHDRAVVMGSTTYGKGSAQSIFDLEADQRALRLTTALWFTPSGRSIQRPHPAPGDTAITDTLRERPLSQRKPYRTDAGRTVYGGGGITPDIIVTPQDSADGTLALIRLLGRDLAKFRDATVDVATQARGDGAVRGTVITITPAMRDDLFRRAQAKGVHLSRAQYDSAAAAVNRILGDEIARDALGAEAAWRKKLDDDRVVTQALALAAGAQTEQQLLTRAADQRAARHEDVPAAP